VAVTVIFLSHGRAAVVNFGNLEADVNSQYLYGQGCLTRTAVLLA